MNELTYCAPQIVSNESAIGTVRKEAVIVQSHVWKKIHGWCKAAKSEVSGLGLVRLTDKGMEVYDVFLPKQKCSSAYTELDDLATPRLITRLHKTKRATQDLRFWWHTHYNFGVFWSTTDDNNAREMVETNGDWLLSIVVNQAGDYRCRVDTVKPVRATLDKLTVYISQDGPKQESRKRNFKADIRKYVRPMTHAGPDESGDVSYVGGRPVTAYDNMQGRSWQYPGFDQSRYRDMADYGVRPLVGGYDPYSIGKGSEAQKPLDDWWERYQAAMEKKGKKVIKPSWVAAREKQIIKPTQLLLGHKEQEKELAKHYLLEEGERIVLEGKAKIYHGGMFLT